MGAAAGASSRWGWKRVPVSTGRAGWPAARAARRDRMTHIPIATSTASTSQRPMRPRCPSTFSAIDITLPPDAPEG